MIKKLLKGYGYAASSASAATIKDADGLVLCQLEAGKQGYFIATTNDIDVGTSDVEVVQVRGTSGGCSGGGGGGVDPTPYLEEIARLEGEIEILEGQITTLEAEVASLEADVEAKAAQIAALNEQITGLQAQITTLQGEIEDLEDEVEQKDAQITTLQARVAELEASVAPLLARIAELEAALTPNSLLAISDAGSVQPLFSKFPSNIKFQNLPSGTVWSYSLEGIKKADEMFSGCTNLTSWNVELPNGLTSARSMFYNTGLRSFNTPSGTLPNSLTDASYMFRACSSLTSWTVALPNNLYDATMMFVGCGLTSWTVALPETLRVVSQMFSQCTRLTSWTVALPSGLREAQNMFSGSTGLTSFSAVMPSSLSTASGMFSNCKLDKASVQNIVDTIPTYTSGSHPITIGVKSTLITQEEQNAFNSTLVGKKWTVTWQRN